MAQEIESQTNAPSLLSLRGLTRRFGGLTAVDGIDLDLAKGELVSIIGPNGAGKTTLFNLVTGLDRPGHQIVPNRPCGLNRTSSKSAMP